MKKVMVLLFVLVTAGGLAACGNSSTEKAGAAEEKPEVNDLADVVELFQEAGLEIGEQSGKAYEMIGAVDGFSVEVNGELIELYQFDLDTASDVTKTNVENASKTGEFEMMGELFPMVVNGEFGIFNHEEHPDKDSILEVFKSF